HTESAFARMKKYSIFGAAGILAALILILVLSERDVPRKIADNLRDIQKSMVHFEEAPPPPPSEEFGIQTDDMYICTDVIKPNENLSHILTRNGIPYEVIHDIATKSQEVFDVRKLKAGKSYCIMRTTDSLDQKQYFIYEQDPVNYVVYEIGDTVSVRKGAKHVTTRTRVASGVIESSLWNTLTENDIDPQLAIRLSEIYAWSIDFFRLHKGDYFKVIFDEKFVDGERVGMGEVKGAFFQHVNRPNYAIKYAQDSFPDFFDENANSLRKAFLKAPLQFRRISSRFNKRRFHPILKKRRPHLGTDYAAPTGTPIWSIGDGVITKRTRNRGSGNYIEIRHNGTYSTKYLHMSKFEPGLAVGSRVSQGQTIGYVGMTGLATGPHLHFEMLKNGEHVDSQNEDVPPGDPVRAECLPAFEVYRDQIMAQLKAIPKPVKPVKLAGAEAAEGGE
ncbi:MAG: peptidoglycan DD-metalloendopeptidase family protein, partial [Bacteroidota bacterium]